jgi:hypothetical protein
MGYKTPQVMQEAMRERPDQCPLTVRQLRDTLDALESRGLILRYHASPRNVYFKTKGTVEDLLERSMKCATFKTR